MNQLVHRVSGVSGAAPVWRRVMLALHAGRPSRPLPPPAGVVATRLAFDGGSEPERTELFVAGTEMSRVVRAAPAQRQEDRFGIVHPADGSRFALDPDIPPAAQRIVFEGEHGTWQVDGRRIGQGTRASWAPWPGPHVVSLVGRDGRVLQSVRIEVRGATVARARP